MAISEITYSLQLIDFYDRPEIMKLAPGENLIYDYCLKQAAKNNLGMFIKERGVIAFFLKVDHDLCYNFFLKYPDMIGFCPDTHVIWCKNLYNYTDFGLRGNVWVQKKVKVKKKVMEIKTVVNKKALYAKNNFITKINSTIREHPILKNHHFVKEWVKKNQVLLEVINDEVKSVNGNGDSRNFDELLSLVSN